MARQKNLRLTFADTSAVLRSDRRLLRRLLQNLVSNAIKYTRRGGVVIGCRRAGSTLRLEVWDSGHGIALEQQARIFEEFQRLEEGARAAPGLGLGLSIVERLRQVLGHAVSVRSRPGEGSLFAVIVPRGAAIPEAPVSAPVASAAGAGGALQGLRVTVIDNEPRILDGMRSLLEGWGCAVSACASRAEALAAPGGPPHAILADYHLEEDDGIGVIAALRGARGGEPPAALITADRSDAMQRAAAAGGIHILYKPVKPAALRALLQQAAARRE